MTYKYAKECKYIWNNLIPESGQAASLQGELLRQIEKLAWEAQNNGNINWDSDFEFFCDFLNKTLSKSDAIGDDEKKQVTNALMTFKNAGKYARKLYDGEISDKDFDIEKIAYIKDDLYYIVRNAIGAFYAKNKELIAYDPSPDINR